MKHFKKCFAFILIIATCFALSGCNNQNTGGNSSKVSNDGKFNIVTSFYPMHILTMNLTNGIEGVSEKSMSDPNLGCIHDHTFTTDDLKKIENADVFIESGLDLESFNDKIKKAYPNTAIIEASTNVTNIIKDNNETNGHVWTNIDNYILQIQYVSSQLQNLNPENKDKYAQNEKQYIDMLNNLKSQFEDDLSKIAGKKALVLDESLPYLCNYAHIEVMDIDTDHEQESLSAEDLKNIISNMKKDNVKSIFITKNSDRKNAEAIAKETGAAIYELNSCMVGEVNSNAYLNYMSENFDMISNMQ